MKGSLTKNVKRLLAHFSISYAIKNRFKLENRVRNRFFTFLRQIESWSSIMNEFLQKKRASISHLTRPIRPWARLIHQRFLYFSLSLFVGGSNEMEIFGRIVAFLVSYASEFQGLSFDTPYDILI